MHVICEKSSVLFIFIRILVEKLRVITNRQLSFVSDIVREWTKKCEIFLFHFIIIRSYNS